MNPLEFRQLILNLVLNAIDAMRNDGGRLSISARSQEGFLELEVADSGTGIHSKHLEKIFDPFFSTKGANGTGLGLWVSKNKALSKRMAER